MLPKQYRISSSQMRFVLRRGKIARGNDLKITSIPMPDVTDVKIGFVVSSRVEKTAVGRHKVKRLLRESIMQIVDKFPPRMGYVITVERHIPELTIQTLISYLQNLV